MANETLVLFGREYDTPGFKAKDDLGATHTFEEGGGGESNDFIVTIEWNDTSEKWEPDCTYAEVSAAYSAGKTIVAAIDNTNSFEAITDGRYDYLMERYEYYVYYRDYQRNSVIEQQYALSSLGLTLLNEREYGGGSTPTLETITKTYTPTTSQQTEQITPSAGYDGIAEVDVTVNAMPSGTEGTPTATKGAVSNHQVSVTPSVTNTAGYIAGGTKTGTAVTVSASELDSGTKQINQNGTGIDVVGYASVDVNVSAPAPTLETVTKTYTPTESQQTETITPGSGYDGIGEVDVTVNAISSNYVGSGVSRRSSSDLTASGATVTAPAGYYENGVSKAVASGTAGTPTATKGAVSNHSISVTPSVQNTTGYITGGTKTGTAVTVTASELVSGSETKTANGTYDVTNLASLVVAVPIVTYYVSSTQPASMNEGDIWLQPAS